MSFLSHRPRLARLLLPLGTLAFVGFLLAAGEGVLRLCDIGEPDPTQTSRLKYQQVFLPVMEPAERADGTPVYRTVDPRLPYQTILRDKPEDALRVFVFGGSATAGLGFSCNVTFARHLEQMLETALPERTIEVVNLGIVASSSRQVALMVGDVAEHLSPDLMIVYSGNNEFLELHAEKFAEKGATPLSRLFRVVSNTNTYRALGSVVRAAPEAPAPVRADFSHDDLRVSESRMIEEVEVRPAEIAGVIDDYEANLQSMVDASRRHSAPILLASVASNWEWLGRSDLPEDWIAELTGIAGEPDESACVEAVRMLGEQLETAADDERYRLLFKRASAQVVLGDFAGARRDYREAMNVDPHLRRALDAANERVAGVAERNAVPFLDMVAALAERNPHGIVGFDQFYDYVHFTPEGAVWAAAALLEAMVGIDLVPASALPVAEEYVRSVTARFDGLQEDFLAVHEWLGIGFGPGRLRDRDLWKFDRMLLELDELLESEPRNFRALVYSGNAKFYQPDGAQAAEAAYRAALEIRDDPDVRANLERLLAER